MARRKQEKRFEIARTIRPPTGDGPWLLRGGLWYLVENLEFNADEWSASKAVPVDGGGPYLFYEGAFYDAGLTDDAEARINEPFLELARAMGRLEARLEFDKLRAEHPPGTRFVIAEEAEKE